MSISPRGEVRAMYENYEDDVRVISEIYFHTNLDEQEQQQTIWTLKYDLECLPYFFSGLMLYRDLKRKNIRKKFYYFMMKFVFFTCIVVYLYDEYKNNRIILEFRLFNSMFH
jgi:hypothetical protein